MRLFNIRAVIKVQWFFDILIVLCSVSVIGMFFYSFESGSGIFKSVRVVVVLAISAFVINAALNIKIAIPEIKADYNIDTDRYLSGVKKVLCQGLEENIKAEIENIYPDAKPEVYVISTLTDEYRLDISYVSVRVKQGNETKIKKIISQSCGIEKNVISVEKE